MRKLFEKYLDLSASKFKYMLTKLDEAETLEEAFDVVKTKIVLTEFVINKITADAKDWDKSKAAEVEKKEAEDSEKLEAAELEAAKIKAENKKQGGQARAQLNG